MEGTKTFQRTVARIRLSNAGIDDDHDPMLDALSSSRLSLFPIIIEMLIRMMMIALCSMLVDSSMREPSKKDHAISFFFFFFFCIFRFSCNDRLGMSLLLVWKSVSEAPPLWSTSPEHLSGGSLPEHLK